MPSGKKPTARPRTTKPADDRKIAASNTAPAPQQQTTPGKAAPALTPKITMTLNHEQIAQRAYAIWVAKGRPQGQDTQNWHEAETTLKKELAKRA